MYLRWDFHGYDHPDFDMARLPGRQRKVSRYTQPSGCRIEPLKLAKCRRPGTTSLTAQVLKTARWVPSTTAKKRLMGSTSASRFWQQGRIQFANNTPIRQRSAQARPSITTSRSAFSSKRYIESYVTEKSRCFIAISAD